MKSPNKLLFMFLMVSSTCMVASSSNWLMTWMGLEINMLGYIPLMFMKESSSESEAAVKYLVPQSLGSTIFIASAIISSYFNNLQILMLIAMCLKLGVAPFHFWFPPVMASLQLTPAFILLTWQKIAPILAISSMNSLLIKAIMPIATISALWGGIGGLNQTDIRSLLTYSSIAHTGWMLVSINSNYIILIAYLTTYILINMSIYTFLSKEHTKSYKQLFSSKEPEKVFILAITILSLGGLPPLMGFIMKLLVLMFTEAKTIIISGLILGALVSLFYYLSLTFSTLLSFNKVHLTKSQMTSKQAILFLLSQIMPLTLILFLF
uniref:NADH-ubiquinone oxidoreductase chain 2 n=1 Tax=Unio pictorum TaxID=55837 RepID=E5EW20_UNIPI|nr:NADH dehydrogenase subunit 2 [Unio pictorum]ADE18133.1 NADH dehydrogenase subunit 2 [Unio pictorum]ADE18146.1 NADH dehydrogenase subunit 2 [Unio pictorum]ADE18172.1 NADH dehydrogenase subunit 2 [Unio pictorum]WFF50435.1 NADH dehydrogenase subunit 2 [Unio pictorum]WFF50448.1 NADH dehydrogenase subunit 2 [Unio pictorum]